MACFVLTRYKSLEEKQDEGCSCGMERENITGF